jgi:CDP-4-dehydro-6-deoxyglucose reductase
MPRIHVQGTEVDISAYPGETMLDALKRTGNAIRVGCRRGGCAICKVEVVEGTFEYTRPIADKVLTDEEKEGGTCLTCRAVATSDMVVSLEGHHERVNTLLTFFQQLAKDQTG